MPSNSGGGTPKKKNLILITNHFPYGAGEAFLQSEFGYVCKKFDRVYILSRNAVDKKTRESAGATEVYRINPVSNFLDYIRLPFLVLRQFPTVIKFLREEFAAIRAGKNSLPGAIIKQALHDINKALLISFSVRNIIQLNDLHENITIYSYWMNNAALAALFLKTENPSIITICRAHGGDVFEFRQRHGYLSFRSTIIRYIDKVFSISDAGVEQLKKYSAPEYHHNITIARLGTNEEKMVPAPDLKPHMTILSCSFIVPVKRLNLLIDALQHIELRLEWIHIGDGPLFEETKLYAERLRENKSVSYSFRGFYGREELRQFYRNNAVHLFINTSSSEGIPVAIMEAQSFGVPALAPEVGGIPEIISSSNGGLFPVDASPAKIAREITRLLTLPENEYSQLRTAAFETWRTRFNADHNFPTFVDQILALRPDETE